MLNKKLFTFRYITAIKVLLIFKPISNILNAYRLSNVVCTTPTATNPNIYKYPRQIGSSSFSSKFINKLYNNCLFINTINYK